ncbi:MAG TPA: hypothetical protein VMB50_12035 [Myxococcales bacterium]|nr:hypothetical protein [Myxococcales bacterium]
MKAVLALTLLVCAAPALATPAPLSAAEREKKELRFVELLRQGLHAPPPDQKAGEAMANELRSLLFALAGVDPAAPPSQATAQKIVATQADVLARRDPALRDEILRETKRYLCRMKQSEAKTGSRCSS